MHYDTFMNTLETTFGQIHCDRKPQDPIDFSCMVQIEFDNVYN